MALTDLFSNLHLLLRWLHVLAGIVWLGHLYFFNFVNVPFQGTMGADVKKSVNPQLLGRAFWWFRWGAMATFVIGLLLFTQLYMYQPGVGFGPSELFRANGAMTGRAVWILFGMTLGTIMWFNVWFIIWPAQRQILPAVRDGQPVDPALPKKALKTSRLNAYLSGPMLFGMLAPSHYGGINVVTAVVAIALGLFAIWWAIRISPSVGKL
ncbi:MAG: urate hydroxylase PuuD [Vicinamibacterales bacterium]